MYAAIAAVMDFAYAHKGCVAFRYPRGSFILENEFSPCKIELGKAQILIENSSEVAFLGYGQGVGSAKLVLDELEKLNLKDFANLIDLIFAKPLDENLLKNLAQKTKLWFVFSPSAKIGGIGSLLASFLQTQGLNHIKIISFEYEDKFIEHGSTKEVEQALNLSPAQIAASIKNTINS